MLNALQLMENIKVSLPLRAWFSGFRPFSAGKLEKTIFFRIFKGVGQIRPKMSVFGKSTIFGVN